MRKRLIGSGMACVLALLLLASTTVTGQDTTTMLSKFLVDLRSGALGVANVLSAITLTTSGNAVALTATGAGKVSVTGTTPMIQLGGTSSSFAAFKSSGTGNIDVRLADDSTYAQLTIGTANLATSILKGGTLLYSGTAPSAPSSCGTSPTVTSNNGTAVWVVTGGTGGTATGCTITMPAATTGWACSINNLTGSAAHRADKTTVQTASTTTSVTWEYQTVSTGAATAFTASDVFRGICFAF